MTSDRILSESEALPEDGALIFVGSSSIAQKMFNDALKDQDVRVTDQTVFIDEASFARADHTIALVARLGQRPALWVFWPEGTDAQRFAERLRHYSSYGAVVFKGHPNVLKQTWRVTHSPLTKSY